MRSLLFHIRYEAPYLSSLAIQTKSGNIEMSFCGGDCWKIVIQTKEGKTPFRYCYLLLCSQTGDVLKKENINRNVPNHDSEKDLCLFDTWQDNTKLSRSISFFSSPSFLRSQSKHPNTKPKCNQMLLDGKLEVFIHTQAPLLRSSEKLFILGSCKELGNWCITESKGNQLQWAKPSEEKESQEKTRLENYFARISLPFASLPNRTTDQSHDIYPIFYKYVIERENHVGEPQVVWESFQNRSIDLRLVSSSQHTVHIRDSPFRYGEESDPSWKGVGLSVRLSEGETWKGLDPILLWASSCGVSSISVHQYYQEEFSPFLPFSYVAMDIIYADIPGRTISRKGKEYKVLWKEIIDSFYEYKIQNHFTEEESGVEVLFLTFLEDNQDWLPEYTTTSLLFYKEIVKNEPRQEGITKKLFSQLQFLLFEERKRLAKMAEEIGLIVFFELTPPIEISVTSLSRLIRYGSSFSSSFVMSTAEWETKDFAMLQASLVEFKYITILVNDFPKEMEGRLGEEETNFCIIPIKMDRSLRLVYQNEVKRTVSSISSFPTLSICASSSLFPNGKSLSEWWRENATNKKEWFCYVLGEFGEIPNELEPWISRKLFNLLLESPSLFSWFSLRDIYSLHHVLEKGDHFVTVEAIVNDSTQLTGDFREMIANAGRS